MTDRFVRRRRCADGSAGCSRSSPCRGCTRSTTSSGPPRPVRWRARWPTPVTLRASSVL